jgi:hypothetical protein
MEVTISRHATSRMKQRAITTGMVMATLTRGVVNHSLSLFRKGTETILTHGDVTVVTENGVVITVWRHCGNEDIFQEIIKRRKAQEQAV